jgi:hypothetical protein
MFRHKVVSADFPQQNIIAMLTTLFVPQGLNQWWRCATSDLGSRQVLAR